MLIGEWWSKYSKGELKQDYDNSITSTGTSGSKKYVQCVDTANSCAQYVHNLGYGVFMNVNYAKDIFDKASEKIFIKVKNTPTGIPPKGSYIIWNRGNYGHIAICTSATVHSITVLESNYDGKGSLRKYTYDNYNSVVGWLIPYKTVNVIKGSLCGLWDSSLKNLKGYVMPNEKLYISGTVTNQVPALFQVQNISGKDSYTSQQLTK